MINKKLTKDAHLNILKTLVMHYQYCHVYISQTNKTLIAVIISQR